MVSSDDAAYIATFILFILITPYFRKIENVDRKKWLGSFISLVVPTLLCRVDLFYPVTLILVNCCIIKIVNERWCHVVSFIFSTSVLLYIRTLSLRGLPTLNGPTNMIMMIAVLKVIGLAFEVHDLSKTSEKEKVKITFLDSIHYCLFYAGYLSGPYYTYRVFHEYWLIKDFSHIPCWQATKQSLMYIPRNILLVTVLPYFFPYEFIKSDQFFESSFWIQYGYMLGYSFSQRYRLDIGFILAECVCTSVGLGAFPTATQPRPGFGPTTNLHLMKLGNTRTKLQYDFEAVTTLHDLKYEFNPSGKYRIKQWNRTVQNWLTFYIFRRIPVKSLAPRTFAVFMYSSLWHSLDIASAHNYFFVACYVLMEGIWSEITNYTRATGTVKSVLSVFFCLSWRLTLDFVATALYRSNEVELTLRYFACFSYFYYFLFGFLALGLLILSRRKTNMPNKKRS